MKAIRYMDEELVIKRGIEALIRELGPVETNRFLSIPKHKRMESVKRHREWQRHLDKDAFFEEVFGKE